MPFDEAQPSRANDFNRPPEAIGFESGIGPKARVVGEVLISPSLKSY